MKLEETVQAEVTVIMALESVSAIKAFTVKHAINNQ